MALAATIPNNTLAGPRVGAETLRLGLLWLMGFAGAFVFIEPSPYEVVGVIAIFLFALSGLSVRPALVPLLLLLLLLNVGFGLALTQLADQMKPVTWVLISLFLATTAMFYAAMLGSNTQRRLDLLMSGYIAAAVVSALIGVAAYFHAFGSLSDMFLLYDRARGTFNDPNVLGAFLVLPGLLLLHRVIAERLRLRNIVMLMLILAALLLSFSRGAWGVFTFAALVVMILSFLTTNSPSERLRIIAIGIAGALLIVLFVTALLSIDKVAKLFSERATLEQSYDLGHFGRFGRYTLGASLALEHPFGIGPLQFAHLFPEDPHNTFLNAFMSGGWLGGVSYLALTALTIVTGARFIFVRTPWQSTYHAVYAAYLGVAGESAIIDIDHWRHYFLILGVLWGLIAVSSARARRSASRVMAVQQPHG